MSSNGSNEWGVGYSAIVFMEQMLGGHANVAAVDRHDDIVFEIKRKKQADELRVVLCNEYALSLAVVVELQSDFGPVDIICYGGNWNKVTEDARNYAENQKTGTFTMKETAGALWRDDFWAYVPPGE